MLSEPYPSFGIGIPCYNEEQNIGRLLKKLNSIFSDSILPEKIIVISSACVDSTDAIVRSVARESKIPIHLISEPVRKGKGSSINRILKECQDIEIVILLSADVLPRPGCLERLLEAFRDPQVGVAGGRPIPEGPISRKSVRVSRLMWRLHHLIAMSYPKSTEITVVRNIQVSIDETSLVDEAELEYVLASRGYRIAYVPEATISTQAPLLLRDFVRQRIRVTIGHMLLAKTKGYVIGTIGIRTRLRAFLNLWKKERFSLGTGLLALLLEAGIYVWALIRSRIKSPSKGIWKRIKSTKRPFIGQEETTQ